MTVVHQKNRKQLKCLKDNNIGQYLVCSIKAVISEDDTIYVETYKVEDGCL
jgi:hypothetical protein